MKLISIIFTAALLSLAEAGFAQGFTNLNFEIATVTPIFIGPVVTNYGATLPGWTAYIGTSNDPTLRSSEIYFDTLSLGGALIILEDSNYPAPYNAIQGNFSVFLSGGGSTYNPPSDQFSASIGQTGTIPTTAKTLSFWGNFTGVGMQVTFNGQPLSFTDISNTLNSVVWGANISAYAGQTGQLLFTAIGGSPYVTGGIIDNIQFSSIPIPEPSAFALAALGTLLLGFRRRQS
jgi:hypothetical protein